MPVPTLLPPHLVLLLGETLVAAAVDGRDEQQGAGQGDDGDDEGRAELVLHLLLQLLVEVGDVDDAQLSREGRVRIQGGVATLCQPPLGTSPRRAWGAAYLLELIPLLLQLPEDSFRV